MNALIAVNAIQQVADRRQRRRKVYQRRTNPFDLRDLNFKLKYRFNKETIRFVINLVEEDLVKDSRGGGVSPELQVLVAVRCWGRREVQDDAGDLHGLSQPTVSRICARVAQAIARKAMAYIKMPHTIQEQAIVIENFSNIKGFPGVIGAIDCTHIRIKKTGGDEAQYYINRKGYYSLNVQVVCDADLRIMDVVARWRGSTHDSRIFNECQLKNLFEEGHFRGRLIGDSGYPLLPYLFTPILRPGSPAEEAYNEAQIATRNTIERCFGVWKQRFQCLLHGLPVSFGNCKTLIIALAVLHNIAIEMNDFILDQHMVEIPIPPAGSVVGAGSSEQPALSRRTTNVILQSFISQNF